MGRGIKESILGRQAIKTDIMEKRNNMKVLITGEVEGLPIESVGDILELDSNTNETMEGVKVPKDCFKAVKVSEEDTLIKKVLAGEDLTESELEDLFYEFDDLCIEVAVGPDRRWNRWTSKTLNLFGRYFKAEGDIALTENGVSIFDDQPLEVHITPTVVITREIVYKEEVL